MQLAMLSLAVKFKQLQIQGAIQGSLDEAYVFNPIKEQMDDFEEQILNQILTQFEPEQEAETNEEDKVVKLVSVIEAIAAIDQLHQ